MDLTLMAATCILHTPGKTPGNPHFTISPVAGAHWTHWTHCSKSARSPTSVAFWSTVSDPPPPEAKTVSKGWNVRTRQDGRWKSVSLFMISRPHTSFPEVVVISTRVQRWDASRSLPQSPDRRFPGRAVCTTTFQAGFLDTGSGRNTPCGGRDKRRHF